MLAYCYKQYFLYIYNIVYSIRQSHDLGKLLINILVLLCVNHHLFQVPVVLKCKLTDENGAVLPH